MLTDKDRYFLKNLVRKAGGSIMNVFISVDFGAETEINNSPSTIAKKASYKTIVPSLMEKFPFIPVISEEDHSILFDQRKNSELFWLIDPLNGTKEFIKREKDFTVNIALIQKGIPIWGVVYAPARDWLYYGGSLERSIKEVRGEPLRTLPFEELKSKNTIVAVHSKSQSNSEEDIVHKNYGVTNTFSMGSNLKFCLVAEGIADLYYCVQPTWEWTTAAVHAVLLGADSVILSRSLPLAYNKPGLKNNFSLICLGKSLVAV